METLHYKTETLVEVAYKAIKRDITERVLIPGGKIIIRELYEKYGISETPIKQALNRLVTEGLVESIPRKGMKVRSLKWEDIEELMEIRLMIETYYIKQAIQTVKNDPSIRLEFERNVIEHKRMIENISDVNEYFRNYSLDQEFHWLFVKCSGNKRVLQIYSSLGTHAYSYYVYGKQDREGMIAGVREHEAVYNALKEGNEEQLLKAIELHLRNAKRNVRKMLGNSLKC